MNRYQKNEVVENNYYGTQDDFTKLYDAISNNKLNGKDIYMKLGKRLDHIAFEEYGDGKLWWIICIANNIGFSLNIPNGTKLFIPDKSQFLSYFE